MSDASSTTTCPDERDVTDPRVSVELLPAIASVERNQWQRLLRRGDSDVVFLTREWQQAWWDSYGRGTLLLAAARRNNDIVALSSLFSQEGMVYFVGSGGSDCLDFIGDISDPEILDALLTTARDYVEDFVGFRFYFVPERSRTGGLLAEAAARLSLDFCDEGALAAPVLSLNTPGAAEAATNKKTVRQHERMLERTGAIELRDYRSSEAILRWQSTPSPSLVLHEKHRQFYQPVVQEASDTGWLRFAQLRWQDRTIASHFGFCYGGNYSYYKPAFAVDLTRYSPGQVLLRRLILAALDEHASTFDFGIGDEPYKQRFATSTPVVKTGALFAPGRRSDDPGR
jgi:CelD/BcsL family acetyltransferase involved in cellulose biosynthesis